MGKPMRVLSLMGQRSEKSIEEHFALYDRVIALHSGFKPDVIVFPENATSFGMEKRPVKGLAEAPNGPSLSYYAATARKHKAWVVGGCYLATTGKDRKKGDAWNAAVIMDRAGRHVHTYKKTYPVCCEYSVGIAPGPKGQAPVKTEFGLVGVAICFDIGFDEVWVEYGRKDTRVIFWPSAFPGGNLLNGHAVTHGYWIITSTHDPRMRVIDPMGRTMKMADVRDRALEAVIELDEAYVNMDYANMVLKDIRARYGKVLEIEADSDLGWYRFVRKGGGPSIRRILDEFKLTTNKEYYAASRKDIDLQRKTGKAPKWKWGW
jgi:predicted amidohydrolase